MKPLGFVALIAAIVAVAALGLAKMERRVLADKAGRAPRRMEIRLASRPNWMPEALGRRIVGTFLAAEARYHDEQLTETIFRRAAANPWVREVFRVIKRRSDSPDVAVLEVDAAFRPPIARLRAQRGFAYVDAEGVRLPAEQVPKWAAIEKTRPGQNAKRTYYLSRHDVPDGRRASQIHYIIIEGVVAAPPAVGQRWPGQDLAAGLRMVRLVAGRPYAWQITEVDVRNYDGRVSRYEPHLRMSAQVDRSRPTNIRFGRFPLPGGDYVVSPERKLAYLDDYVTDHGGHLAGINRYIDLRYDELHISIN